MYLSNSALQSNRKLKMLHVRLQTDFSRSHHNKLSECSLCCTSSMYLYCEYPNCTVIGRIVRANSLLRSFKANNDNIYRYGSSVLKTDGLMSPLKDGVLYSSFDSSCGYPTLNWTMGESVFLNFTYRCFFSPCEIKSQKVSPQLGFEPGIYCTTSKNEFKPL